MIYVSIVVYKRTFLGLKPVAVDNTGFLTLGEAQVHAHGLCKNQESNQSFLSKMLFGEHEYVFSFASMISA